MYHALLSENLISLREAGQILKVNPATIWRWQSKGVTHANGLKTKLEALRCGGKWITSREALDRFVALQNPADPAPIVLATPSSASRKAKRSAADRAGEELERMGM